MTGPRAMIAVAAMALLSAAPATADPLTSPTPTPPVPVPAPAPEFIPQQSGIGNPLAQAGTQGGLMGLPAVPPAGVLLGQNNAPAAPGAPAPAALPNLSAFNPEYLLGQNVTPAVAGEGTPAPGLAPNEDIGGTGRIAFLRRIYAMYEAGLLKGALLGQNPLGELPPPPAPPTP